jgi:NIMA (never in mitosis gene a)-related kinase
VKRIEDGLDYALKKVKIQSLSDREKENALNEVRILASIKNPFVASYKQAFFDEPSSSLW